MKSVFKVILLTLFYAQSAWATSLKDYKAQKHKEQDPPAGVPVVEVSCEEAYLLKCRQACSNESCRNQCVREAPVYCRQRDEKRSKEQALLWVKAATLFLPAIGCIFDEPRNIVESNLSEQADSYTFVWNRASFYAHGGTGVLNGGAKALTADLQFRLGYFGASGNAAYLFQGSEKLIEYDVGPTFYVGSAHISAGFQPSLIGSAGSGVKPEYGFGMRTVNTLTFDRFHIQWNPLLGRINKQWFYQLKGGVGYRLTPSLGMTLGYEYRNILDLNDLEISSSGLHGFFVYFNYRFN